MWGSRLCAIVSFMVRTMSLTSFLRPDPRLAWRALRTWTPRRIAVAVMASIAVAVLVGVPTVLIPNSIFSRDVPPTWWSYPVWILTSILSGMLVATYFRADSDPSDPTTSAAHVPDGERTNRFGVAGTV